MLAVILVCKEASRMQGYLLALYCTTHIHALCESHFALYDVRAVQYMM